MTGAMLSIIFSKLPNVLTQSLSRNANKSESSSHHRRLTQKLSCGLGRNVST
jgi:hypothetical protein